MRERVGRLQFGTRADGLIDTLGTRCKKNRVAFWFLECAICKVVDVGSKVCSGSWTWSGRKHPVGRYRAASGVWSSKIASAD